MDKINKKTLHQYFLRKPIGLIFVGKNIVFFRNNIETFANKREPFQIYTCKRGMYLIYQSHFS